MKVDAIVPLLVSQRFDIYVATYSFFPYRWISGFSTLIGNPLVNNPTIFGCLAPRPHSFSILRHEQRLHFLAGVSRSTMEGQGVINYNTDKTSYAISASTTQFDDELIRRRVITREQAIAAKGASIADAQALANPIQAPHWSPREDNDSDDDDEYLDDGFLEQYREQRMNELHQQQNKRQEGTFFGEAVLISRTEWQVEVNDASEKVWVVVCLTSSDTEKTGCVEEIIRSMARTRPGIKFVLISSQSAIPNWPEDNLPSLFLYRHGKMQNELLRLPRAMTLTALEQILETHGVGS